MKTPKPYIHPNCPKKLVSAFRKSKWNMSLLSRNLGVNKGVVHRLIKTGYEPSGEELRVALFLPRHPRKIKSPNPKPRVPLPTHRKWWNKQSPEFKDSIIVLEYTKSLISN